MVPSTTTQHPTQTSNLLVDYRRGPSSPSTLILSPPFLSAHSHSHHHLHLLGTSFVQLLYSVWIQCECCTIGHNHTQVGQPKYNIIWQTQQAKHHCQHVGLDWLGAIDCVIVVLHINAWNLYIVFMWAS